jgi:hypothetical protein
MADMCGAFVAVDEGVVARQAEGGAGGKVGKILRRVGTGVRLLRTPKRRVQQMIVAYPDATAVFGQLTFVDGDGEWPSEPDDHGHGLLRQLAQDVAVLAHHFLGHFHLLGQGGVVGGETDAVGGFQCKQLGAFLQTQARVQFARQDDAGGVADGSDREFQDEISQ